MIGYTDGNGKDWSGFTIEAQRLTRMRDEYLNQGKIKKALKAHYELEDVELELGRWIVSKL